MSRGVGYYVVPGSKRAPYASQQPALDALTCRATPVLGVSQSWAPPRSQHPRPGVIIMPRGSAAAAAAVAAAAVLSLWPGYADRQKRAVRETAVVMMKKLSSRRNEN